MIKYVQVTTPFDVTDVVSKEVKTLSIGTVIQIFTIRDDSKGLEESKRERVAGYKLPSDPEFPCAATWGNDGAILVSEQDIILYTTHYRC